MTDKEQYKKVFDNRKYFVDNIQCRQQNHVGVVGTPLFD